MKGSRKPLLGAVSGGIPSREPPIVELRDGRRIDVISCLLDAGDLGIAAERAQMSDLAFSRLLVQADPTELAEVLRAIRLMGTFRLTEQIEERIRQSVDDIKPELLLRMYPDLVNLLPELAMAPIHIQATQNNFTATGEVKAKIPAHIQAALKALGIDPDREPGPDGADAPTLAEMERYAS